MFLFLRAQLANYSVLQIARRKNYCFLSGKYFERMDTNRIPKHHHNTNQNGEET